MAGEELDGVDWCGGSDAITVATWCAVLQAGPA